MYIIRTICVWKWNIRNVSNRPFNPFMTKLINRKSMWKWIVLIIRERKCQLSNLTTVSTCVLPVLTACELEEASVLIQRILFKLHPLAHHSDVTPETVSRFFNSAFTISYFENLNKESLKQNLVYDGHRLIVFNM